MAESLYFWNALNFELNMNSNTLRVLETDQKEWSSEYR
jgi:hypothetical protein